MTPRQFHVLLEQYQHKVEHLEMLNGLVCSTVANWSMGAPKKALTHVDFMPSAWAKQKPVVKRRRKMSADEVSNEFKNIFSVMTVDGKEETTKPRWVNKRG